jgi:hypothetical protein
MKKIYCFFFCLCVATTSYAAAAPLLPNYDYMAFCYSDAAKTGEAAESSALCIAREDKAIKELSRGLFSQAVLTRCFEENKSKGESYFFLLQCLKAHSEQPATGQEPEQSTEQPKVRDLLQ